MTTSTDRQKAESASRQVVEILRRRNSVPRGDLKVSDKDYQRLEREIKKRLLLVMEP